MAADDFKDRIVKGYSGDGPFIDLGCAIKGDEVFPEAVVRLPASMANRHGLIAGATGTGKTKTLQLITEQLSDAGVAVFTADIKGDLTGLTQPGEKSDRVVKRVNDLQIEWTPNGKPVTFLSLGGIGAGVPVRAAISSFGPQLLAKVLGANETQTSSLSLVFHFADQAGLPLLDLADLRAVLQYLSSDDGEAELEGIGGLSKATVGVLLRKILELDEQGAEAFFGEPEIDVSDLIRTEDGKGVISCLELTEVQDKPKLFSTFLMWLLAELFQELPEVGDLDKPKIVFFFDEAHLLFDDASDAFLDQVAQTVRLIRSKGVGVFFVTQLPDDVPDNVLAQLGNRVQHALRAFTPRDAKALKATVTTFPKTKDYDLEEDLTRLGVGEAFVTVLSENGAPTPLVWTRMRPPVSLMGAIETSEIDKLAKASELWPKLSEEIDRDSARERLAEKMGAKPKPAEPAPSRDAPQRGERPADNVVVKFLKSREGRATINTVVRGVFGMLRTRR